MRLAERVRVHFFRGKHGVGHQMVVLSAQHRRRAAALLQRNGQGFTKMRCAFLRDRGKRLAALGIDHLHHADQLAAGAIRYRHHQHLLGAVSGAAVHFL